MRIAIPTLITLTLLIGCSKPSHDSRPAHTDRTDQHAEREVTMTASAATVASAPRNTRVKATAEKASVKVERTEVEATAGTAHVKVDESGAEVESGDTSVKNGKVKAGGVEVGPDGIKVPGL